MFNKRRNVLIAVALFAWLCSPMAIRAGSVYELICENRECHYTDRVSIGGGMRFEQITGYCVSNGKFVYLTWDREHRPKGGSTERVSRPRPTPMGYIWAPSTGQYIPLYQSNDCPQPFIPITSVGELKFCPKCKQPTLGSKRTRLFD